MDSDLIIFFRDLVGANKISIFADNAKLYNERNSSEHILWDDAKGHFYVVRLNGNNKTYDKEPISIQCSTYNIIQYMSTTVDLPTLKTLLEALKAKGIPCDVEKICREMEDAYTLKVGD